MGLLNFRWLVNFGLLVLPIAVTLGILLGLQKHRDDTGQPPLFTPPPSPTGAPKNNKLTTHEYCQKSFGISPDTKGQEYTLNPNQWGWNVGDEGGLCLNVTTFNNETYPTNFMAPEFSVTWMYPPGPETAPVHAFPNIKVDGHVLPATVSSLSQVNVDLQWTYGPGNTSATTTDVNGLLTNNDLNANVAIDMFLDADQTKAQDSTAALYEIMVWFADFGNATQPIGFSGGSVTTKEISGTTFTLYYGQNDLTGETIKHQNVLTWVASDTTESFTGDISPLLTQLPTLNQDNFPSSSDYLGYMAMGSETYSSNDFVTFHVPLLSIDIESS